MAFDPNLVQFPFINSPFLSFPLSDAAYLLLDNRLGIDVYARGKFPEIASLILDLDYSLIVVSHNHRCHFLSVSLRVHCFLRTVLNIDRCITIRDTNMSSELC